MGNFPTPKELLLGDFIPLTLSEYDFVIKSREAVVSVLEGRDPRILLIVGPCSLHERRSDPRICGKAKGALQRR